MVMMLDLLKQRSARPHQIRIPNLELLPDNKVERLEVRDYDYDTGDSAVWHGRLPIKELYANLPIESRIRPNYAMWRKVWAGMGWFFVFISAYAMLFALLGSPFHPIFPAVILSLFGLFGGWMGGAKLTLTKPFWVARRIWTNGVPTIQPIVHTLLRGEPEIPGVEEIAELLESGEEHAVGSADSAPAGSNGHGMNGNGHAPEGLQVSGFPPPPVGVYVPRVYTAAMLFEDLQMREERQDMRLPADRSQLIKLGGMILLTGGLVVGLIFVLAVTSNTGAAGV